MSKHASFAGTCLTGVILTFAVAVPLAATKGSTTVPGSQGAPTPPTAVSGAPPVLQSLVVDGGVDVTYDRDLCLKWAPFTQSLTEVEYRASENSAYSGAPWRPVGRISGTARCFGAYALGATAQEGPRTIYLQLRDRNGVSATRSAQITYHAPPAIQSFALGGIPYHGGIGSIPVTQIPFVRVTWQHSGVATQRRICEIRASGSEICSSWDSAVHPLERHAYELMPLEGEHTLRLDLRRDQSPIVSASTKIRYELPLVDVTLIGPQVSELVALALSRGYLEKSGPPLTNTSGCRFTIPEQQYDTRGRAAYPQHPYVYAHPGRACTTELLYGKPIYNRWQFVRANLVASGGRCRLLEAPPEGAAAARMMILTEPDANAQAYCGLTAVTLRGPLGQNWTNAFNTPQ